MPKIYEYLGIILFFYSNEHEPIHIHGKFQGAELKQRSTCLTAAFIKLWSKTEGLA